MITGTMKENSTGYVLTVSSLTFDLNNLQVVPNPYKKGDNHPDYHVEYRTPRGRSMRIGSMWKAVSERSNAEYFSIILTDKNRKTWRMNAVRNDTVSEGHWVVVPLAGGTPERIMVAGELTETDDGALSGAIESFDFAMTVTAVPTETKTDDSHPDFHLEASSHSGKVIRVGSVWKAMSQNDNAYYSLAFWSPFGTPHRANAVKDTDDEESMKVIPLAERETESTFA